MLFSIALCWRAWVSAYPVAADTYPCQLAIDAQHYTFRLTLSDDSDEIVGEATVDLRFITDGGTKFWLDLTSPMGKA